MRPLVLLSVAALVREKIHARLSFVDCLDRSHPALNSPPKTKPDGRGPFPKKEVDKPDVLRSIPRRFSRYGLPLSLVRRELKEMPTPVQNLDVRPRLAYFSPIPGTRKFQGLVEAGCLQPGSDPLVHNKLAFPYIFNGDVPCGDTLLS